LGMAFVSPKKRGCWQLPKNGICGRSTCPGCCWQCSGHGHGSRWVKGVWGRSTCPRCCWQCSGHGPRWVKGVWGRFTCRRGCWQCNGYGPRWEVDPRAQEVAGSAMAGVLFQHPGMALGADHCAQEAADSAMALAQDGERGILDFEMSTTFQ